MSQRIFLLILQLSNQTNLGILRAYYEPLRFTIGSALSSTQLLVDGIHIDNIAIANMLNFILLTVFFISRNY